MFSFTQPLHSFTPLSACSGQSMDSCGLAVAATAGQAEPWEVCSRWKSRDDTPQTGPSSQPGLSLCREVSPPRSSSTSTLHWPAAAYRKGLCYQPLFVCQHGRQWLSQKSLLGKLSSSLFYNEFLVYFLGLKTWGDLYFPRCMLHNRCLLVFACLFTSVLRTSYFQVCGCVHVYA